MNVAKLVKRAKRGDKDALVQLVMHEKNNITGSLIRMSKMNTTR